MIGSLTVTVFPLREKECPSFTSNQLVNNCPPFPLCAQGSSLYNVDLISTYAFTNNHCNILTETEYIVKRMSEGKKHRKRKKNYDRECRDEEDGSHWKWSSDLVL